MRYAELCESVFDFDPQKTRQLFDLDLKASRGDLTAEDRDGFIEWLRLHKNDSLRLYHATDAKHDIIGQGLLPTSAKRRLSLQSGSGYVYLAYDPQRAKSFAQMGNPYAKEIVIYAADVPIKMLRPDADQLFNKRMWGEQKDIGDTLADSLIYGGGARVKGAIPSGLLTIVWRGPKS